MNVTNEKELWEAFRNRETTITAEGEAAKKVSLFRLIRIVGLICGICTGITGFFFIIFGVMANSAMNSINSLGGNSGGGIWVMMLVPVVMFWGISAALIILVWLGKGHKLLAQLRNYNVVNNEGVLTLTRK